MKVNTACSFLGTKQIQTIEKKYDAKYVLETDLLAKDKHSGVTFWANRPAAIFYTEKAHPEGSNYFAIYMEYDLDGKMIPMITNGLSSIKDVVFSGLEAEDEVIYSRYRHDYRTHKNGAFVDGGRDYFRYGGDKFDDYNVVKFKVVCGKIEFLQ
jgi:hypothetical protein